MATDKSEPRVGVIAQVGIVSVVTLVAIHAALVAYFDRASYDEQMRKVAMSPPDALMSARASEKERLSSGSMPISKAMEALENKGRMGASPDIMPSASHDVAPLQGWTKLPAVVPPEMVTPPAAPSSETAPGSSAPSPASSAPAATASAAPKAPAAPPRAGEPKPAPAGTPKGR